MSIMHHKKNKRKGAVFMFVVVFMSLITISIGLGFTVPNIREFNNAQRDNFSNGTFLVAEAGNEDIYYRVRQEMNVPAEVVFTLNGSIATTTVTAVDANNYIVETESEADLHVRKSRLRITDLNVDAEFLYGAQIGTLGAEMSNNTEIEGVLPAVGDIYSDGPLVGGGFSSLITGNAYVSTSVVSDNNASSTTCITDQVVGAADPEIDFAQSFIASTTDEALNHVDIYLKKNGNPGSRTVRIVPDAGGVPDTTEVTSGTLDRNKVTSTYSWVSINLDTAVDLVDGNTYWIVLDAQRNNSNNWAWCIDGTNPYAGGSAAYSEDWDADPWTAVVGDLTFKTYYGEGGSIIDSVAVSGDAHGDSIIDSTVGGDAYYQTDFSGSSASGTEYPGSPTLPPLGLPLTTDAVDNWIIGAESGGTVSGNCPDEAACSDTMGPIKIDGDLTIDTDTFTVTGTVYVTGNLFTDNNAVIQCDASYGTDSCVVIVDGYMDFQNGTDFAGSGDPKSFILLLSRKAGCEGVVTAGCGQYGSAIYHSQTASAGGIFYAQDSVAHLENNATVSTVVAKGLVLNNNAAIQYDVDLQDIVLSAGTEGGWVVSDWREVE